MGQGSHMFQLEFDTIGEQGETTSGGENFLGQGTDFSDFARKVPALPARFLRAWAWAPAESCLPATLDKNESTPFSH